MTDERSFEILHFSVRYPRKVSQFPYFVHNLVWRAIDPEFKSLCEGMAADWTETEIVFDKELAEEYINELDFSCTEIENQFDYSRCEIIQRGGLRRDAVYHKGWQRQFPFVYYIEKFDCFRSWGFTESNAITQACIHELNMLKLGEHTYGGRFAPWSHFRRVIDALESFWD